MGTVAVDTPQVENQGKRAKRPLAVIVIPIIGAILALSVLLYPVVATLTNNASHNHAAKIYDEQERNAEPARLNQELADAHEYNATRSTGPILDPWLARISTDNEAYQDYLHQLDATDSMGRIVIPKIKVDLPILHGTSDEVLFRGVGHLFGSDLPVGGDGTHAVLTGHTGLPNATLFDHLVDLGVGDAIYLQVSGEKLKYEVRSTEVVLPDEVSSLKKQPGKDLVTLVTCTPYGVNSHRLLVHAERVPMDSGDALTKHYWSVPRWILWFLGAALLGIATLVWWLRRLRGRTRPVAAGRRGEVDEEQPSEPLAAEQPTSPPADPSAGPHRPKHSPLDHPNPADTTTEDEQR